MRDPLAAFPTEKVAADAPTTGTTSRHVTQNPSSTSSDPGERALAGLIAAGSSVAAKAVPWIANTALRWAGEKGQVPWHNALPVQGVSSIHGMMENAPHPRSKLLGMFDITARSRPLRTAKDAEAVESAINKLHELQPVVDSFIDKHHLAERGVTLNFNHGPLGSILKNRYVTPSREAHFSHVGKEPLLHELGHAADYTGSRLGRFRGVSERIIHKGALIALPIALVAGDHIKHVMPGTIDDKAISFMQDHAPAIMAATLAATSLYPEAKASFLATRHIAQTEGRAAALESLKRFVPNWGTYLLGAIPAVVGMSLARKYMREAREENEDKHEKAAGEFGDLGKDIWHGIKDTTLDLHHVGSQIGNQALSMIHEPGLVARMGRAAKAVGTSPEFVQGALTSALPAAMSAMYLYATPSGKHVRSRIHPKDTKSFLTDTGKGVPVASRTHESWREQHPWRFVSLVAAGAALSGGIISKMFHDLERVM